MAQVTTGHLAFHQRWKVISWMTKSSLLGGAPLRLAPPCAQPTINPIQLYCIEPRMTARARWTVFTSPITKGDRSEGAALICYSYRLHLCHSYSSLRSLLVFLHSAPCWGALTLQGYGQGELCSPALSPLVIGEKWCAPAEVHHYKDKSHRRMPACRDDCFSHPTSHLHGTVRSAKARIPRYHETTQACLEPAKVTVGSGWRSHLAYHRCPAA